MEQALIGALIQDLVEHINNVQRYTFLEDVSSLTAVLGPVLDSLNTSIDDLIEFGKYINALYNRQNEVKGRLYSQCEAIHMQQDQIYEQWRAIYDLREEARHLPHFQTNGSHDPRTRGKWDTVRSSFVLLDQEIQELRAMQEKNSEYESEMANMSSERSELSYRLHQLRDLMKNIQRQYTLKMGISLEADEQLANVRQPQSRRPADLGQTEPTKVTGTTDVVIDQRPILPSDPKRGSTHGGLKRSGAVKGRNERKRHGSELTGGDDID